MRGVGVGRQGRDICRGARSPPRRRGSGAHTGLRRPGENRLPRAARGGCDPAVAADGRQPCSAAEREVAASILENMSQGRLPCRPELGTKGSAAFFVAEGNPWVGIDAAKTVEVGVEITGLNQNAMVFTEADVLAIYEEEARSWRGPEGARCAAHRWPRPHRRGSGRRRLRDLPRRGPAEEDNREGGWMGRRGGRPRTLLGGVRACGRGGPAAWVCTAWASSSPVELATISAPRSRHGFTSSWPRRGGEDVATRRSPASRRCWTSRRRARFSSTSSGGSGPRPASRCWSASCASPT